LPRATNFPITAPGIKVFLLLFLQKKKKSSLFEKRETKNFYSFGRLSRRLTRRSAFATGVIP
jgi:predicted nucleic acid-binding OB-fold protein